MYCWKCGAQIDDDSLYCSHCGAIVGKEKGEPMNPHRQTPGSIEPEGTTGNTVDVTIQKRTRKTNPGSIVGFVISMLGIVLIILAMVLESIGFLIATAAVGGVGAIVSAISLGRQEKTFRSGNFLAQIGITFGVILFVAGLIYSILL